MSADLNSVWTVLAALLVYFMHGGFGFYEAGMCRSKNTVDTLSHNLLILAVTILVYWGVGFGLMFGEGNGFTGMTGFVPSFLRQESLYPGLTSFPVPLVVAFAFAMSFADTPATLIAGTGAERIRFSAVMILTIFISGLLFPIVGHWVIGGGWLSRRAVPVFDTGSAVVHLCGGCCALGMALVLGPRIERDDTDEDSSDDQQNKPENEPTTDVSSMPMVFLGAFILWLGFFAFNAGFAMHASRSIGLVVINTALGGAAGTVAAILGSKLSTGKLQLRTAIVGLLTANVAITSPAGVVEPWAAVVIGAVAGFLSVISIRSWPRLGIDDPTEYLTMNLVGGILGTVSIGLFVSPAIIADYRVTPTPLSGLFYGGGSSQLLSQLLAAGGIILFVFPSMLTACLLLRAVGGLRVNVQEEIQGSDRSTHGEKAYKES